MQGNMVKSRKSRAFVPSYESPKQLTLEGKGLVIERNGVFLKGSDEDERWDIVENYELYLFEEETGKKQLLLSIPKFNDTFVEILWIGDLDEDGKPDFIFYTSPDYEYKQIELFLSSPTDEHEIVNKVAVSSYDFSC